MSARQRIRVTLGAIALSILTLVAIGFAAIFVPSPSLRPPPGLEVLDLQCALLTPAAERLFDTKEIAQTQGDADLLERQITDIREAALRTGPQLRTEPLWRSLDSIEESSHALATTPRSMGHERSQLMILAYLAEVGAANAADAGLARCPEFLRVVADRARTAASGHV